MANRCPLQAAIKRAAYVSCLCRLAAREHHCQQQETAQAKYQVAAQHTCPMHCKLICPGHSQRAGLSWAGQKLAGTHSACCLPVQALALCTEGCLNPHHAADPGMHRACLVQVLALIHKECGHKPHAVLFRSRHWLMRDEYGIVVDEVHGAAVIGEHPILVAGKFS